MLAGKRRQMHLAVCRRGNTALYELQRRLHSDRSSSERARACSMYVHVEVHHGHAYTYLRLMPLPSLLLFSRALLQISVSSQPGLEPKQGIGSPLPPVLACDRCSAFC